MSFIHQICPVCEAKNGLHIKKCRICGTVLPRTMLIIITVTLVLLIVFSLAFTLIRLLSTHGTTPTPTPSPSPSATPNINNGISVKQVKKEGTIETIGISDGSATFYTSPDDLDEKNQAAEDMKKGDVNGAIQYWQAASKRATNDAEPLIYMEDQAVLKSGNPYITIVVGVMLSPKKVDAFSTDFLQAAYIAQRECNDHTLHLIDANNMLLCPAEGKKLRLLIANSGSDPNESAGVAQQIVLAAKADPTIVGVLGWPTSQTTLNVIPILQQMKLPIISASNASDELSGKSDFFRTGSPISDQMLLIQQYISTQLKPQRMVIFYRSSDKDYSLELATKLHNQFPQSTSPIAYISRDPQATTKQLNQAAQTTAKQIDDADVVVMATNNVQDLVTLLQYDTPADAHLNRDLKVFTGGTGYELVEAGQSHLPNYNRVVFCTPTFADIWGKLGQGQAQPDFFKDYDAAYDPNQQRQGDYTYGRPNSTTMLAYDDMLVLLEGSETASDSWKQNFTPAQLTDSLKKINDQHPLQGISGKIAFDMNGGDPVAKTNLILRVDDTNHLHLIAHGGCFLVKDTNCNNPPFVPDN